MRFEDSDLVPLVILLDDGYAQVGFFITIIGEIGRNIENIAPSGIKKNRINTVVITANAEGWLPALLDKVGDDDRLTDGIPLLVEVARLKKQIAENQEKAALSGGGDPLQALVVFNRPFFNRQQLRNELDPARGSRIFTIAGEPASGKSHSWYLVRHLAEARGIRLAKVDMKRRTSAGCEPTAIMNTLAQKMKLDTSRMPTDKFAQDPRIGMNLAAWFVGASEKFVDEDVTWWIGIDGLDQPVAGQGASDLAGHLALAIDDGELQNVNLFILAPNPNFPLPSEIADFVASETTLGVRPSEVRQHIREIAEVISVSFEEDALDILVDAIFDGLPVPVDHDHMDEFRDRYKLHVESVIAAASANP